MVIFNKSRCYNGGEQHKFRPRYNAKSVNPIDEQLVKEMMAQFPQLNPYIGVNDLLYNTQEKTYIYDICIWCGKTIKRKEL